MSHTAPIQVILILLAFVAFQAHADEPEPTDEARIWDKYATDKYSDLNAQLNGELTPVFRTLGDFGELHEFFDRDHNPKQYEAYRQFLVQALADAMRGDVMEGMFEGVLLEMTPPNILLAMIAPEIATQGKLHGILNGQHSDAAKHIQRQPQRGDIGPPNFIEYVRYLKGSKVRGFTSQANAAIIVDHMFRTDPQEAFVSMLWADYGFNPHVTGNCYLFCREDTPAVRNLQLAHAAICDYLSRTRYSFPIREDQAAEVADDLRRLADHEKWWVRFYVACLITRERQLRHPDLIKRLIEDRNEHVHAAMDQLAKEEARAADVPPAPAELQH